jgi:hypothetical protein
MSQWIYLSDMAPQATIINPETGELRQIMSSAVKDRAPAGIRRYVLEELSGGTYRETGEVMPLTTELFDDMIDCYVGPNNWNFDWPHWQTEIVGDENPDGAQRITERLSAMMQHHPYDFKVTGLQRRFLLYYSDGDHKSQQRFERYIPLPKAYPFRSDGKLQRRYEYLYNSIMRDAGVPVPKHQAAIHGGSMRPCLYIGSAWVVRFTLDGHDPLLDRCRVYVDDDAGFICSDWCQRHDYTSYHNGINLQTGIYDFDTWVTGPCIIRNTEQGWRPKNAEVKRVAVRELMAKAPPPVPQFDEVLTKAKAAVTKYAKAHTPTPPPVEAGPITADVMAEAIAAAEAVWASKAVAETPPPAEEAPMPLPESGFVTRKENWQIERVAQRGSNQSELSDGKRYYIAFNDTDYTDSTGTPYVAAVLLSVWNPSLGEASDVQERNQAIDALTPTDRAGFAWRDDIVWYLNSTSNEIGEEELNDHWWMWDAAVHYKTNMQRTAVQAVLLEA